MRQVVVLAAEVANLSECESLRALPKFRKSTLNMIIAHHLVSALSKNSEASPLIPKSGLILGSSYGELENSKEFLRIFSSTQLARPFLFQSSLHNATAGFLSLEFKMQSPSFSVSQEFLTGEKCLETGVDLIKAGILDSCVIVSLDIMCKEFLPCLGHPWKDGGSAILLCARDILKDEKPIAEMDKISITSSENGALNEATYHSSGLEKIISSMKNGQHEILLKRPHHDVFVSWTTR
jgi:hypothetical protein